MTRSTDRVIGGVCAGLSAHLGIPVSLVRALIVAFAVFGGAGLFFYVWLWATVPNAEQEEDAPLKRVLTRPADGFRAPSNTHPGEAGGAAPNHPSGGTSVPRGRP